MTPHAESPHARRAERTYAAYLGHLFSCPRCGTDAPCGTGDRLRRALRAARAAAQRAQPLTSENASPGRGGAHYPRRP
ncbi:hypothetical protein [Streptomyces sp. G45]|uniref:hypothetical protein n=1 Tax=Streptomyces sp. G45 TaxID=3406627 RepID=UPI003C19999D